MRIKCEQAAVVGHITGLKLSEDELKINHTILKGINEILGKALTCRTEEELGETCLSVAEKVTQSKFGFIGEIGEDGLFHNIAISNPGWNLCTMYDQSGHKRPPGDFNIHGLYGQVLVTGKSLTTNEPSTHQDSIGTPEGHPPLTSFLGTPLKRKGRTVGIIAMGNRGKGYTQKQVDALEELAPVIIQAFGRKRVEEQRERTRKKQGLLLEASTKVLAEKKLPSLLDLIASAARTLTDARIATSGHGHINGQFTIGGDSRLEGTPACPSGMNFNADRGGVYMDLMGEKNSLRLTDSEMRTHPWWWGLPKDHALMRGLLGARITDDEGKPSGLIMVTDKVKGDFTEEDEYFLLELAAISSLALQQIKARSDVESELLRTKLLQEVAVAATTGPDIKAVAGEILTAIRTHLKIKAGDIRMLDTNNQVLQLISSLNYPKESVNLIKEVEVDNTGRLAVRAIRESRLLTHEDEMLTPDRVQMLRQRGIENDRYIYAPINYRGNIRGILSLTFGGKRSFTQSELDLFHAITHIIGQSIENSRLYEAKRKRAEELAEHRRNLELTIQKRTKEVSDINARLRQSEAQYRQIVEASPDAYFVFHHNRILFANQAALQLFGYANIEEINFVSLKNLIPSEAYKELKNLRGKAKESKNPIHLGEIAIRNEEFIPMTVEVSVIPVVFEGETAQQYIVRNITQRKEMEKEMARLDRLNLVGEMAAGIGHEVRNPMTSVRGFLQLLANKEKDPGKLEYYDIMIEELDRANSIITEFLSLAKDRAVKLTPSSLNGIINSLYPLLSADGIKQDKHIILKKGDNPTILLNEKEIRQLIINLVRNGMEAMPPGGTLTIGTWDDKDEVVLFVEDEGTGIKPEVYEKLGTPFFTTKENGTGLGLSVCYSIANKHNARIDVKTGSTGTTFYVRFKK